VPLFQIATTRTEWMTREINLSETREVYNDHTDAYDDTMVTSFVMELKRSI